MKTSRLSFLCPFIALLAVVAAPSVALASEPAASAPEKAAEPVEVHYTEMPAFLMGGGVRVLSPGLMEDANFATVARVGLILPPVPELSLYFEVGGSRNLGHETAYGIDVAMGVIWMDHHLRTGGVAALEGLFSEEKEHTLYMLEQGVLIHLTHNLVLEPAVLIGGSVHGGESDLASGLTVTLDYHFEL